MRTSWTTSLRIFLATLVAPIVGLALVALVLGAVPTPTQAQEGPPPDSPPAVDTDGDGIADNVDRCPAAAGSIDYKGCPAPDELGVGEPGAQSGTSGADAAPDIDDDEPDSGGMSAGGTMALIGGITMTVGAVALLVGGGLWISSCATRNSVHLAEEDERGIIIGITQREARDQLELADDLETSSGITAAVGGGLLLTGLVLSIVGGATALASESADAAEASGDVSFAPSVSPEGGGMSMTLRF